MHVDEAQTKKNKNINTRCDLISTHIEQTRKKNLSLKNRREPKIINRGLWPAIRP